MSLAHRVFIIVFHLPRNPELMHTQTLVHTSHEDCQDSTYALKMHCSRSSLGDRGHGAHCLQILIAENYGEIIHILKWGKVCS